MRGVRWLERSEGGVGRQQWLRERNELCVHESAARARHSDGHAAAASVVSTSGGRGLMKTGDAYRSKRRRAPRPRHRGWRTGWRLEREDCVPSSSDDRLARQRRRCPCHRDREVSLRRTLKCLCPHGDALKCKVSVSTWRCIEVQSGDQALAAGTSAWHCVYTLTRSARFGMPGSQVSSQVSSQASRQASWWSGGLASRQARCEAGRKEITYNGKSFVSLGFWCSAEACSHRASSVCFGCSLCHPDNVYWMSDWHGTGITV